MKVDVVILSKEELNITNLYEVSGYWNERANRNKTNFFLSGRKKSIEPLLVRTDSAGL